MAGRTKGQHAGSSKSARKLARRSASEAMSSAAPMSSVLEPVGKQVMKYSGSFAALGASAVGGLSMFGRSFKSAVGTAGAAVGNFFADDELSAAPPVPDRGPNERELFLEKEVLRLTRAHAKIKHRVMKVENEKVQQTTSLHDELRQLEAQLAAEQQRIKAVEEKKKSPRRTSPRLAERVQTICIEVRCRDAGW